MIKAKTQIDEKAQKTLIKKPLMIYIGFIIVGVLMMLTYIILGTIFEEDFSIMLNASIFPFGFGLFMFFFTKMSFKKSAKNNYLNQYEFSEDKIHISTYQKDNLVGTLIIKYTDIKKVKETNEYIYAYIKSGSAIIIEKANIKPEEMNGIKNLLGMNKNDK